MNDFRVNPERPCKRSLSFHAGVRRSVPTRGFLVFFLSFSLLLPLAAELPFRTFYFMNNVGTEKERKKEERTAVPDLWLGPGGTFSRANHGGHTLRVGRYVTAAGTSTSINLDHSVISPSLVGIPRDEPQSPFDS